MKSSPDRFLVPIVKNCLIAADVAGSAIPKVIDSDFLESQWIQTAFQSCPQQDDFRRIAQVRLNGHDPRPFQMQVAESPSRVTLVMAGCGTGKTVAAYLWAARSSSPRRLYFCYPTTGTATEGFRDYLHNPDGQLGDINTQLFHSRRDIDFEMILSNGDTDDANDDSVNNNSVNAVDQIESLEAWSTAISACTVDTVLGVLQNHKRGRFAWLALAQAALVFDEIHAYDDVLFGKLLRFLKDLKGLPVLLMTASLPKGREQAIREVLEEIDEELPSPIIGPTELEALPRYCQKPLPENNPKELLVGVSDLECQLARDLKEVGTKAITGVKAASAAAVKAINSKLGIKG
ncbi:MAG TPA: hypothetical protein VNQ76_18715 [Planctomicrobium sp.]|nr:hypothetical protein [Planctomicrobium sp.]